ncbi:MAG: hypothetical protein HYX69_13760 [Planctomycetia bacterium]|nr:hypothetical protein [Planctomycetia bacterium]
MNLRNWRTWFQIPRPQWGLRTLFVVVLVAAVAAAVARRPGYDLGDLVMAFLVFWVSVGLVIQAIDLWRTFHGRADLTRDLRCGWRFEALWRVAAAAVIPLYYMQPVASPLIVLIFETQDVRLPSVAWLAVLLVTTLAALLSNPFLRRPRGPIWWRLPIEVAGCGASVFLALSCWENETQWPFLVAVAVSGIENAFPLRYAVDGRVPSAAAECWFFWFTIAGTGAACAALFLAGRFMHLVSRAGTAACAALLGIATVTAIAIAVWLNTAGIQAAMPLYSTTLPRWSVSEWLPVGALFLTLGTIFACRIAQVRRGDDVVVRTPEHSWRRRPAMYFHERRWFALLLAAAIAVKLGIMLRPAFREWKPEGWTLSGGLISVLGDRFAIYTPTWLLNALDAIQFPIDTMAYPVVPIVPLWLALLVGTCRCAFGRRIAEADVAGVAAVPSLPPVRFGVVWLSCVGAVCAGAISLAWLGFAVWMPPLNGLPWP